MPAEYQVGILGMPNGLDQRLESSLASRLTELGVAPSALTLIPETEIGARDRKRPFVGVFFGYEGAHDLTHPILKDLIEDSVVIAPVVSDLKKASELVPNKLGHINCLELNGRDRELDRLTTLLLENFRLLRSDRRLFISYRRNESQGIAIQLFEKLESMGFDVFLDTHAVPPAVDFQAVLWHRLADSDVVVLLGTPGFIERRWTRAELAQANATNIQILHLLWPKTTAIPESAFSQFHILAADAFATAEQTGDGARLHDTVAEEIGLLAESLRARALSARHRYLVDNFCDQARELGQQPVVQSERFIALEMTNSKRIAVVPAVGVPSAVRYQEIEDAITAASSSFSKIWLLYDERGILDSWLAHVAWLNGHLPLCAVRVSESAARIREEI